MFLTKEDLTALTGAKKLSHQVAWLRQHGINHLVNAAGQPVVMIDHIKERLCDKIRNEQQKSINEQALLQVMNGSKKKK